MTLLAGEALVIPKRWWHNIQVGAFHMYIHIALCIYVLVVGSDVMVIQYNNTVHALLVEPAHGGLVH